MELQNPMNYLLDNFYNNKFVEKKKTYRNKTIREYISTIYNKTYTNKKFKKINYVFNPFLSYHLKRNIYRVSKTELDQVMDLIDEKNIINNKKYHLIEFYKEEPISQYDFFCLKNYNFYDTLLFEYITHKEREQVYERLKKFESDKLKINF